MAKRITFSKLDELGRFVIPKQYRDSLGMKHKDVIYIEQVSSDTLLLKCKSDIKETAQNILQELQTVNSDIESLCSDPELANTLRLALTETVRKIHTSLENTDES